MIILFLVVKNEANYLDEYIQYHIGSGIDKVLVLDDKSTDNTQTILQPYIDIGVVDYYYDESITPIAGIHREKYRNLYLEKYPNTLFDFIFIDVDEFLFVKGYDVSHFTNSQEYKTMDNFNIQESVCFKETPELGLTVWNPNIYNLHTKKLSRCSKVYLKIYSDETPNYIDGHQCCYNRLKKYNPVNFPIGFWHVKSSEEEMIAKQKSYDLDKSNPYYQNAKKVREKVQERARRKLGKNFTLKLYSKVVFNKFFQKHQFFTVRNILKKTYTPQTMMELYKHSQLIEIIEMFGLKIASITKNDLWCKKSGGVWVIIPNEKIQTTINNINFTLDMGDILVSHHSLPIILGDDNDVNCILLHYTDFNDMIHIDDLFDAYEFTQHIKNPPPPPLIKTDCSNNILKNIQGINNRKRKTQTPQIKYFKK